MYMERLEAPSIFLFILYFLWVRVLETVEESLKQNQSEKRKDSEREESVCRISSGDEKVSVSIKLVHIKRKERVIWFFRGVVEVITEVLEVQVRSDKKKPSHNRDLRQLYGIQRVCFVRDPTNK